MTRPTTTGKAQDLITFTRSTTGTYLDSVTYGNELVTNGTFDNNIDGWTAYNAVISYDNGKIKVDDSANAGGDSQAYQDITTVAGKTYKLTFDKISTTSVFWFAVGASPAYQSIYYSGSLGTQTGQQVLFFKATSALTRIALISSSTGITVYDNCSVKELTGGQGTQGTPLLRTSAINEARIEYDASGNCLGLLVEEARTNIISTSEALQVASNRAIAESSVSPTGEQTAQTWRVNGSASNNPYMYQRPNIVSGTTYTCTVFVRLPTSGPTVEPRYVKLSSQTTMQGGAAIFDLQEGTVVSSNMASESITPVGNGWYRISVTNIAQSSGSGFSFILWPITNAAGSVYEISASDDGKALFETFGMQTEAGSFPTSYIPTSGSAITRAADVASLAVSEFGYNQDQGTVVVDFIPTDHPSSTYNQLIVSDGGSKRWVYFNDTATYSVAGFDGTNQIAITGVLAPIKAAIGLSSTQGSIAANGDASAVSTDVAHNGNILTSTSFDIAANTTAHIKSIQYYPLRLSNAQLQALTV